MGMALPTRIRPFLTTDLFTPLDKLRMGLDLLLPRDSRTGDLAVGDFLERRLGRALVERLHGHARAIRWRWTLPTVTGSRL